MKENLQQNLLEETLLVKRREVVRAFLWVQTDVQVHGYNKIQVQTYLFLLSIKDV